MWRARTVAPVADPEVVGPPRQRLGAPRGATFKIADAGAEAADTQDFYDRHAEAYAGATQGLSMDRWLLPFAAMLAESARVVDLGSGGGRDLRRFGELGFRAVGLDRSLPLATLAHQYSAQPVVVGDMRNLPLADGRFDGAWASASLLHLARPEIELALREAHRILTPGGVLFASMKRGRRDVVDRQGRSFTYVGAEEFAQMLQATGFEIVDWDEGQPLIEKPRHGKRPWITCLARRR